MTAHTFHKLEDLSRTVALWTSLLAAIIFAAAFLATSSNFGYELERFYTGKEENIALPFMLGMIAAVFIGYLLAGKKKLAEVGGTIAVVAVAAIYGCYKVQFSEPLNPIVMALAGPAIFHLASVEFQRAAARREAPQRTPQAPPIKIDRDRPEVVHETRELAVGAA